MSGSRSRVSGKANFANLAVQPYQVHSEPVHSVDWNCSGSKLASGSADKMARVWNLDSSGISKCVELSGHTAGVTQLCWSFTNANTLATCSEDKSVRVWDVRAGSASSTVSTAGENINITWSPNSNYIAVGNKEDVLTIIDTRKNQPIVKVMKFPFEVNEIAFDHSGSFVYLTTGLGQVEVMFFPDMKQARTLQAHTASCYCIEFDPSGKLFATGSADSLVTLWNTEEMVCERTFGLADSPVRAVSFSHDSQYIAMGSEDDVINISHVGSGEQVHAIPTSSPMNTLAWHPSKYLLAYAGDGRSRNQASGVMNVFGFSK